MILGTYFPPLRITHIDELISKLSRPCRVRRPDSASTSSANGILSVSCSHPGWLRNVSMVNDNVLYDSLFCDVIFAVAEATKLTFLRTSHETEKIVR